MFKADHWRIKIYERNFENVIEVIEECHLDEV